MAARHGADLVGRGDEEWRSGRHGRRHRCDQPVSRHQKACQYISCYASAKNGLDLCGPDLSNGLRRFWMVPRQRWQQAMFLSFWCCRLQPGAQFSRFVLASCVQVLPAVAEAVLSGPCASRCGCRSREQLRVQNRRRQPRRTRVPSDLRQPAAAQRTAAQ